MGTPFMGEIKIVAFNFAPKTWALANGQLLPINQNQALFSLFGTTYGGNGQTTFALPDLRGRIPIHFDGTFTQGQAGGEENHTITMNEMAAHNHFFMANSADGDGDKPQGPPKGSLGALNVGYNSGGNPDAPRPGRAQQRRRQPAPPEHAALSGAELLRRPERRLPVAE